MRVAILGLGLAAAFGVVGCKQKSQLVLGIITNLKVSGELSDVTMDLSRNNVLFQSKSWPISDQKALDYVLPGSFTLYSDNGGEPLTEITVTGFSGALVKVTRTATIQLQSEQDLFYRMSLVLKCSTGMANASENCPQDFSCIEGICKPIQIDARTLKPYESSRVNKIECDSGTAFFDTSTCSGGNCMTIPAASQSCGPDEFCSEGTCYQRDPIAPRMLEFGEACDPTHNDACRETGLICGANAPNDQPRCRQTCTTDTDCARRLPDATAKMVPASNARCTQTASQSTRTCTYACDPLDVADGGCLSGTVCSIIDVDSATNPLAGECVTVRSGLTIVPLGGTCTSEVGQCGAGAVCLTVAAGTHCRKLCETGGLACPSGEMCTNLTDSKGRPSPTFGVCCPVGGCN